jgi:hypothetical protein
LNERFVSFGRHLRRSHPFPSFLEACDELTLEELTMGSPSPSPTALVASTGSGSSSPRPAPSSLLGTPTLDLGVAEGEALVAKTTVATLGAEVAVVATGAAKAAARARLLHPTKGRVGLGPLTTTRGSLFPARVLRFSVLPPSLPISRHCWHSRAPSWLHSSTLHYSFSSSTCSRPLLLPSTDSKVAPRLLQAPTTLHPVFQQLLIRHHLLPPSAP